MNIKPIKSEEDYIATLNQIESLMDVKLNTPQSEVNQEYLKYLIKKENLLLKW